MNTRMKNDQFYARQPSLPAEHHRHACSRRQFLRASSAIGIASLSTPALLHGQNPNETLNVACVGVGGMAGGAGVRHADTNPNVQVVALCDVDAKILGGQAAKHPRAKTFSDYRRMLDVMGNDIDAVTIGTPDHMHGPIALAAMDVGKHVYCEKPLAHNIAEVRGMTRAAERKGVVTQMGTQIHSYAQYRSAVAALRDGAIGKVSEAHLWINASWAGPPEGRPRKTDPVPAHLNWDLWLGVAPRRPFVNGLYLPYQWRRWKDFGGGTLGDMGCHLLDPIFSGLDIETVNSVRSTGPQNFEETFAPRGRVEYEFAGSERTMGALKLTWAERSAPIEVARQHLPAGVGLPKQGSILIGEKGMMVIPHFDFARIYRDGEIVSGKVDGQPGEVHAHQWHNACRSEVKTSTPFSYAGPLTEAVLLGVIAGSFQGETLTWDSDAMRFTNSDDATVLVKRTYEPGREVDSQLKSKRS